jgi:hypothetical protein
LGDQEQVCRLGRMLSKTAAPGRTEGIAADPTEYCRWQGSLRSRGLSVRGPVCRCCPRPARRKPDLGQECVGKARGQPCTSCIIESSRFLPSYLRAPYQLATRPRGAGGLLARKPEGKEGQRRNCGPGVGSRKDGIGSADATHDWRKATSSVACRSLPRTHTAQSADSGVI